MINATTYKQIADLINNSQEEGENMVLPLESMYEDYSNSELLDNDISANLLIDNLTKTHNILNKNYKNYSTSMLDFVKKLQDDVYNNYGSVNDFLTDNNIKVFETFADISRVVGYMIDSGNIGEEILPSSSSSSKSSRSSSSSWSSSYSSSSSKSSSSSSRSSSSSSRSSSSSSSKSSSSSSSKSSLSSSKSSSSSSSKSSSSSSHSSSSNYIIPFNMNGDSTLSGMGIDYAVCTSTSFEVITTGARFVYSGDELKIYQGLSEIGSSLPSEKILIATCLIDINNLVLEEYTSDRVIIDSDILYLYIFGDSTIIFYCKTDQEFNVVGYFVPEYDGLAQTSYYYYQNIAELYYIRENKAGGIQIVPERYDIGGGYAVQDIYSNSNPSLVNNGSNPSENPSGVSNSIFYDGEWGVSYYFTRGQRCLINVFPTRSLDYNKWLTHKISDFIYSEYYMAKIIDGNDDGDLSYSAPVPSNFSEPPLPSDSNLDLMKQTGNVIVIWGSSIYSGATSYSRNNVTPKYYYWDIEDIVVRTSAVSNIIDFITRAHAKDMKVIFYVTLFYFYNAYEDMDSFCSQIETLKTDYNIDGIYVDGLACDYSSGVYHHGFSFIRNYEFMRRMRLLFGEDGILFIHGTNLASMYRVYRSDNIHLTTNIAAMSYADYSFNGEGVDISHLDDFYLHYHTSQYGLSNCISSIVYEDAHHTVDITGLAVWMANQYGSHHHAWSYNNPTHDGVTWLYQETMGVAFSYPFLAEAAGMSNPNPSSSYTTLLSGESLSATVPAGTTVLELEFNLKNTEQCSLVVNATTYIVRRSGNNIIFDYGVNPTTLDIYNNNQWNYSDTLYNILLRWNGFASSLFQIEITPK